MFDPAVAAKKVSLEAGKDLVQASAVNFYGPGVTQAEVEAYYAAREKKDDPAMPLAHGLNSRIVRGADGQLQEQVYKVGGLYGPALVEGSRPARASPRATSRSVRPQAAPDASPLAPPAPPAPSRTRANRAATPKPRSTASASGD